MGIRHRTSDLVPQTINPCPVYHWSSKNHKSFTPIASSCLRGEAEAIGVFSSARMRRDSYLQMASLFKFSLSFVMLVLICLTAVAAAQPRAILLWPNGAPG